ncbi:UvrD-helicase domain-containing protein [Candidatus Saccharibacteria bacterium]|nr:UvrD-helicase domain-containing protein [Candidatus Saccharibacteria bacterium]
MAESDFLALLAKCRIKAGAGARVLEIIRARHNNHFIKRAQKTGMRYADCELDSQQIEAVVACEDAQSILASAGSGKTLSLLAKISYLHHSCGIAPQEILAISFTKKTVEELRERCDVLGIDFCTFHALGNRLLKQESAGGKQLISETDASATMECRLVELCLSNQDFAHAVNDFIVFFLTVPHSPGEQNSHAKRILFNRINLRAGFKNELLRKKAEQEQRAEEVRGDFIRSKAVQLVAD